MAKKKVSEWLNEITNYDVSDYELIYNDLLEEVTGGQKSENSRKIRDEFSVDNSLASENHKKNRVRVRSTYIDEIDE